MIQMFLKVYCNIMMLVIRLVSYCYFYRSILIYTNKNIICAYKILYANITYSGYHFAQFILSISILVISAFILIEPCKISQSLKCLQFKQ